MAKIPEMILTKTKSNVEIKLPLTSQGKFRCKKRNSIQEFGDGFAPKSNIIPQNSYLEWQIGYDTIIGKDEKNTSLKADSFIFTGANKKMKHPYELSEIVFFLCKSSIITKNEISDLISSLNSMTEFLQEKYTIDVKKEDDITFNNLKFKSSSTKLPTFIKESSNLLIEIMIEKQQYATGVQPMLYLDVPISSFINANNIVNHTSAETPYGSFVFDKNNKCIIFDLILCFGMCSKSHNHDVKEILKVILNNAF